MLLKGLSQYNSRCYFWPLANLLENNQDVKMKLLALICIDFIIVLKRLTL